MIPKYLPNVHTDTERRKFLKRSLSKVKLKGRITVYDIQAGPVMVLLY